MKIKQEILSQLIDFYKESFPKHWEDEKYKWVAVKCFQDNWDIDATDFGGMLDNAMKKTGNLLASRNNFPLGMLKQFSSVAPNETRQMFVELFDETKDLDVRVVNFKEEADTLLKNHESIGEKHFQDGNAISTYLWLKYPDKYYIYKYSEIRPLEKLLCNEFEIKKGAGVSNLKRAYELMDCVSDELQKDDSIRKMLEEKLNDYCYNDIFLKTLTIDFEFHVSRYYESYQKDNRTKQYWIYSPGRNAEHWDEFFHNGIMAIGWDDLGDLSDYSDRKEIKIAMNNEYGEKNRPNDLSCNDDFVNKMNIGDVVFVKKGRRKILGYGIVTSNYYYDENREFYNSLRDVDWKIKGEWEHPGDAVLKTLTDITQYTDYVEKLKSLFTMNTEIRQYTKLLKLKQNIILQGAPGTGKTFNTAALALSICGVSDVDLTDHKEVMKRYEQLHYDEKDNPYGQIGFCTFHQSMDYEDFVEGIKPINSDNGDMYYKVKDGIFKLMSNKAQEKTGADILKCIDKYIDGIKGYENKKIIPTLTGRSSLYVWWNEGNSTLSTRSTLSSSEKNTEYTPSPINIEKLKLQAIDEGIENNWPSYAQAIINAIKKEYSAELEDEKSKIPYVLIIDEINRGNVSRIFGELITLLEKDKRLGGEHPIKVTLPYSKESFGVPENLYIIGTMNTTDRSVGNIDYAVRRRFAFATLQSKRDLVVAHSTEKAAVLFDAVKSFIEKNKTDMDIEDLMVGHSYFFAKDDDELDLRWQYEILPLLNEYIKDDILRATRLKSDMPIDEFIRKNSAASDTEKQTEQTE